MMFYLLAEGVSAPAGDGSITSWLYPITNIGVAGIVLWRLTQKFIPKMQETQDKQNETLRVERKEALDAYREESRLQRAHDETRTDLLRAEIKDIRSFLTNPTTLHRSEA